MSKRILFLTTSVILVSAPCLPVQGKDGHQIGMGLGFNYSSVRDNLVSPLIYSGSSFQSQITYQFWGIKSRHLIQISYGNGELISSAGNIINLTSGALRYGYHRYFSTFLNRKMNLFVGGMWNSSFAARESIFKVEDRKISSHYSGEILSSLGISIIGEFAADEDYRATIQWSVPIVTYVRRPGYALGTAPGTISNPSFLDSITSGYLASIDSFLELDTVISYEMDISEKVGLRLTYQFKYFRFSKPRRTSRVSNDISIGFLWQI